MTLVPSEAAQLLERATARLQTGDLAGAERDTRALLALQPDHVSGWAILGATLHGQGRHAQAEEAFLQLTELQPREPMYWMNVGTARRCDKRLDEALAAFSQAALLGAGSADFHFNLALVHVDRNDFESAYAVLGKAMIQAPKDAEIRYRYAYCCYETLRTEEAVDALRDWENLAPPDSEITAYAGFLLLKLGDPARAEPIVHDAAQRADASPLAKLALVQLLERTNRLGEARQWLDRLVADPASVTLGTELTATRAELAQRESRHEDARTAYEQALADCREPARQHFHQYPLVKSLEALGLYEEAWATLQAAHRSQLEQLRLTAPVRAMRGAPVLGITRYSAAADDIAAWSNAEAPPLESSPIFIVAFPRSGTTLLELTLDAHPQLASMDEQPFLQNAIDDMIDLGVGYPDRLSELSAENLRRIRERYWERALRKVRLQSGQRLIDKNPLNMLRLPAIRRLFPNSPVLMAVRHPCDVILSCYQQHFRAPDVAMLCMDVQTLAAGYRRSFDFWYEQHALLQPMSLEIRYETFVTGFEQQVRAISDFLRLPWQDAMLEPGRQAHEKRFISTPSYSQVVQPVTDKSVGRWRHYRQHFEPVVEIVRPYLQRWGYEA